MKRTASAVWTGGVRDGKGNISTQSRALANAKYGFNTRFEDGRGTNPEELIAAAHAGCFTMALAAQLGKAGMIVESLRTDAAVTLEERDDGFAITAIHLELVARIPGADKNTFEAVANKAKTDCPVSRLLNATITLNTTLQA